MKLLVLKATSAVKFLSNFIIRYDFVGYETKEVLLFRKSSHRIDTKQLLLFLLFHFGLYGVDPLKDPLT